MVYVLFDVHLSGFGGNFALYLHKITREHSRAIKEGIKCPASVNRRQIDTVLTYLLDVTRRDLYSLSIEEISFSFVRSPLFFTKKRQIIAVFNLLRSFLYRVNLFSHGCIFEWMWNDRIWINVTNFLDYKNKFSKHWAFHFYHPTFTATWLNSPCYFISFYLYLVIPLQPPDSHPTWSHKIVSGLNVSDKTPMTKSRCQFCLWFGVMG